MRITVFICAAVALAGCDQIGTPQIGPQVEERSADAVVGCELLGTVTGIPKVFGPLKNVGREDAKRVAKRQADKAGANVVVFDPIDPNAEVFQVTGSAYRC